MNNAKKQDNEKAKLNIFWNTLKNDKNFSHSETKLK